MEMLLICVAAMVASLLTLFSGFGLGTLLMPVIALFFPLELAIAMTAIVHLANNLFKFGLLARQAVASVVFRFGVPAVLFAILGVFALNGLAEMTSVLHFQWLDYSFEVSLLKFVMGIVILCFVILESSSKFASVQFDAQYLPVGGMLSGFFGGLSGHQGALRSMFLLKVGLSKEQFVASGVVIAVMIDITRLMGYGWEFSSRWAEIDWWLMGAACLSAFLGAFVGSKLLDKVTLKTVQSWVSFCLALIALGLMTGML